MIIDKMVELFWPEYLSYFAKMLEFRAPVILVNNHAVTSLFFFTLTVYSKQKKFPKKT